MPPKKMTANQLQPARYRPGKALAGQEEPSDDESSEEEEEIAPSKPLPPKAASFRPKPKTAGTILPAATATKPQDLAEGFETASEEESEAVSGSGSGSGSEESSSEEEESSSEEEVAPRKLVRPVFVKKNQRTTASAPAKSYEEIEAETAARRQAQADALLQEQLELAAVAKAAGKKHWDEEDNINGADVDDTDDFEGEGLQAARASWKLRELTRVKRERLAIETAEAEREEVERRRNLSAAEREAEDLAYIENQKEERGERGQASFMQKYFHKGAFFQDDLKAEGVDRRDLMSAKFEDSTNREILPEYMQIRDMTKLGKRSRTKYRDMKTEDTGRWGDNFDRKGPAKDWGVDERFRSDGSGGFEGRGPAVTGANSGPLGERKRPGLGDDRDGKRPRVDDR